MGRVCVGGWALCVSGQRDRLICSSPINILAVPITLLRKKRQAMFAVPSECILNGPHVSWCRLYCLVYLVCSVKGNESGARICRKLQFAV